MGFVGFIVVVGSIGSIRFRGGGGGDGRVGFLVLRRLECTRRGSWVVRNKYLGAWAYLTARTWL